MVKDNIKSNIFTPTANNLPKEIFEDIISTPNIKIERIVSYGHTSPKSGWYEQKENEWVIVLEGEAILAFENSDDIYLQKGDYYNIPSFVKHRVKWSKSDCRTVWLAVFY